MHRFSAEEESAAIRRRSAHDLQVFAQLGRSLDVIAHFPTGTAAVWEVESRGDGLDDGRLARAVLADEDGRAIEFEAGQNVANGRQIAQPGTQLRRGQRMLGH